MIDRQPTGILAPDGSMIFSYSFPERMPFIGFIEPSWARDEDDDA